MKATQHAIAVQVSAAQKRGFAVSRKSIVVKDVNQGRAGKKWITVTASQHVNALQVTVAQKGGTVVSQMSTLVKDVNQDRAGQKRITLTTSQHVNAIQVTAAQNGGIAVNQKSIVVKDVKRDRVGIENNDGYYKISQVARIILRSKYFGSLASHLVFIVLTATFSDIL
jgi:hypothetical protein